MLKRYTFRCVPVLIPLFFLGIASAQQISITSGPNFGSFTLGPVQIPLTATGGSGTGYTWAISSGALPAGLSLRTDGGPPYFPASATAGIIGVATTPVSSPPASFTLKVTDSANNSTTLACTMSILSLAITDPNQVSDGIVNAAYSYTAKASGNLGSVTWSLPNGAGSLPAGLTLNSSTGQISGTPSQAGYFGFNLSATDSTGTVTRFLNIQITTVGFSGPGDLGYFTQGSVVSVSLVGTGGTTPYTFNGGGVPQGLSLSSSGLVSGTITGGGGTYRFNVGITDHNGAFANRNYVINVITSPTEPSLNYPSPAEDATIGEARNYGLNVNGGKGPYTWSISAGSLPPGMTLLAGNLPSNFNAGPDDAVISGAPTATGTYTFTVSLKDSSPTPITVLQPLTINVKALANNYPNGNSNPVRGSAYSYYIQPVGGTFPYLSPNWTILTGNLPAGLSLSSSTGVISGTPTENGNFTIFVAIFAGGITLNRYIGFNVQSPTNPQVSINGSTALPDATVNSQYNYNLNACCANSGVSFTAVGSLPSGLALSPNGQLSGTPHSAGKFNIEIQATDNTNSSNFGLRFFTLNVSPLQVNTSTPNGTVGSAYSTTFTATGGSGLTWTLGPGSTLPPGITLQSNGTLAGTPTSPGSFGGSYTVTDSAGDSFQGFFGVNVYPAGAFPAPTFAFGNNFGIWTIGEIQYALPANGGNGTYTWSLVSGTLPTGLTLRSDAPLPPFFSSNAQAGLIGVATAPGNYTFTLGVTSAGQTSYQYCTWGITAMTLKDGSLPEAFVGVPYNYTLTALNSSGGVTYSLQNGALPPGLTLSAAGVISGTPTQAGNFNFNFTFADSTVTDSRGLNINVSAVHFTTDGLLANVAQNGVVNVTLGAAGGSGSYTFSPGGLPEGLSLSSNGVLSGTITNGTGKSSFPITVTDTSSPPNSYTQQFSIDVIGTPPVLPAIAVGTLGLGPVTSLGQYESWIVSVTNGGRAPFTWNVTGLPPGVSARPYNQAARTDISPGDIEIWGTPTALGTYHVTYTVTDADGMSATATVPWTVSALTVDGNNFPPNGSLGTAYSTTLRVIGGTGPYTVSQIESLFDPLPAGLTLNASAFTLSGTPLETGFNFNPLFLFSDSAGNSFLMASHINISGGNPTITVNGNTFPNILTGTFYSQTLNACCVNPPQYNWSVAGGTLPPGISLSPTGVLSGTATTSGIYTFLIKAADANNANSAGYRQFVYDVTPISISAGTNLPYGTVSSNYSYQIPTSGGTGAMTFVLGPQGPLPPGIQLSSSGLLSGTPTATGQFLFNATISDSAGHSTVGYFNLPVYVTGPPLSISNGPNFGSFTMGPIEIPLTATGGSGTGYTWTLTSGSLPAGLALRSDGGPGYFPSGFSAGIIGVATSTVHGASFTLKVTDSANNSVSQTFTMNVLSLAITDPSQLADGFINVPYSYTPSATGATGSVTWSAPNGGLPQGLSVNPSTGQISGTPTLQGNDGFNLSATDSTGTITRFYNIQVFGAGFVGSTDLGNYRQGDVVNTTLAGMGGTEPYSFSPASQLPSGLTLSSSGVLSGTVSGGDGTFRFTVQIADHTGSNFNKNFVLNIIGTPTLPNINYPNPIEDATLGESRSYWFYLNGGQSPYTWSISAGSLPPGMALRSGNLPSNFNVGPDDAVLVGTPTQTGAFSFTVTVKDSSPTPITVSQPITLNVKALTNNYPNGNPTRGVAYSYYVQPVGGTFPYSSPSWTIVSGTLPNGLSLNSSTGVISGTPTENSNFNVFLNISAGGITIGRYIGFNVNSPTSPTISINGQTALPDAVVNYQYGDFLGACCAPNGVTFSAVGSMPPGLTLNGNGQISGTPTVTGTYNLQIKATDNTNSSNFGVRFFTLNVSPLVPNVPLPTGTVGTAYSTTFTVTGGSSPSWKLTAGGQLPPGLNLSGGGTLSGTPTSAGVFNLNLNVTVSGGASLSGNVSMSIFPAGTQPPPSFSFNNNFGTWTQGEIQYALTASGGDGTNYTWQIINGKLPTGLALRTDQPFPSFFPFGVTAGIFGLATTPGNYSFTLAVTSAGQTAYQYCTWRITPLTLKDGQLPEAFYGVPYSYSFTPLNGAGAVTFTPTNAPPPGLTLSSSGVLSGTPSEAGSFSFNFNFTDGVDTDSRGFTINVAPIHFTTPGVLPNVSQNGVVNTTIVAAGGPYTYTTGGLPGGLSLSSAGVLSGTINAPVGRSNFAVTATTTSNPPASYTQQFSIDVIGTPPVLPNIALNNLIYSPIAPIGLYFTRIVGVTNGGTAPFTWNVTGLPPGMSARTYDVAGRTDIVPDDVEIWGTPTALGTYNVTYTVTDAAGLSSTVVYPFTVSALVVDGSNYPPNGVLGTAYTPTILRVLGGTGPYTVSLYNTQFQPLPDGLTLNTSTFTLSGTPLETGGFGPVFHFADSAGNNYYMLAGFNVSNGTSNPNITIGNYFNLGNFVTGSIFSIQFNACCTPSNSYTWSVAGGTLPPGLSLSASGQLSGTTNTAGAYTFLVKAADATNLPNAGYKQFVLNVTPIALTSNGNLPFGTLNANYPAYQIPTSGATGTLTFTLGLQGPLPPGITLSSSGVLSGTPTQTGQFQFDVYISDSGGHTTVAYLTLPVYQTSPPVAITSGSNLGTVSIGEVQIPLVAAGGTGAFTWSVTAGSLPPGLSIRADKPSSFSSSASAGIIGVATSAQSAAYQFTLTATSGGQSASQAFTLKVTGLTCQENTGFRLPDAVMTGGYSYTFTPLNANGAVTFGSPKNLPPGMTLSSAGSLSGTPTAAGFYNFSFTVSDSVDTATIGAGVDVFAVGLTSAPVLPNATQGTSYTFTYTAGGGTGPYTYTATGIPGGLSLSSAGVLSGTVTAGPGRYSLGVTVTDHNNNAHLVFTGLTVVGVPPSLQYIQPYGNFDDCSYGVACSRGLNVINGGTAPFTWNVTGLPPGISFRTGAGTTSYNITPSDAEIWGAPLALGTFNVTAVVTDAAGIAATQTFPLNVSRLYVDGSDTLPNGTRGTAYSKLMRVLGGTPAANAPLYTTQQTLGVLPEGLTLSGMTVTGTPVENGAFQPKFIFADSSSPANTLHLTEAFTINNSGSNTISPGEYTFDTTGSYTNIINYYPVGATVNFTLNCGTTCTWSVTGGALPTGLSLSSGGVISGTATTAGTYTFQVTASVSGNTGVRQYTIIVTPLNITTSSPLPDGMLNAAYSQQLASTAAATFSVLPDYYLPPGLTLSSGGLIGGTPTATGEYNFIVMAQDAANNVIIRSFTLSVYTTYRPLFLGTGPTLGPDSPGAHTAQLTAIGGKPPYHYSFSPGAGPLPGYRVQDGGQLPQNFSFSAGTGGLIGVSTAPGNYPTSLRVTDSQTTPVTYDRSITFIGSSLAVLNPSNPPAAIENTAYSYTFVGFGGTNSYTWTASGLPAGITMNSSTGTISGTPTVTGTFSITITVTDTSNTAEPFTYTLTVYPFGITTAQVLPQGMIGVSYSQTLSSPNCTSCTWSVVSGSLPGGLTLSSAGVISGKPTGFSNSTFTVQASGSNGNAQRVFALLVPFNTPQPLFITTNPNLNDITIGSASSADFVAQGGVPPYSWNVSDGSLPPGVEFIPAGEQIGLNYLPGFPYIAGRPMQIGQYTFTIKVTDAANNSATQTYNWAVTPLNFNMATFPFNGSAGTYGASPVPVPVPTLGAPYAQQLLVLGGTGNYVSWTTPLASNPLPPGLTLNPSNGVVSGTPTATGSYTTQVQVTDDANNTHRQFITFNIASPTGTTVNINAGPNLGTFASGGTQVFSLSPTGGTAPYTFTVLDSLPPGCALETGSSLLSTAVGTYDLSCAPLAAGTFIFTLKATDSVGNVGVKIMSITFAPLQLYTTVSLANGSVGTAYSQQLLAWDNSGTVNWSVTPGSALPPGLSLTGATGSTISGTPSAAASYSFTLTATDSATSVGLPYTFSITISTITITDPSILPRQALLLTPFSYQFNATGGGSTKTWSATGLPSGLSMSTGGLLSGMPTSTGTYTLSVTATDNASPPSTVTKLCTLFVRNPDPGLMSTAINTGSNLTDARVGQNYTATLGGFVSGGTPPYTWSLASGSTLPPGLGLYSGASLPPNIQPGNAVLGGEPSTAGQYSFTLVVTDSTGAQTKRAFTLNVAPISLLSGGLPTGTINVPYSRQLTAVGGTGPYAFTYALIGINTVMFPPGVSGSPSGLISGTPTSTGSFSFFVTAADSTGNKYTTSYTLVVTNANGLEISTAPVFGPVAGQGVSSQLSTNGSSTYTYSLQSGSLPSGMTLSSTGLINGAASKAGTYNYTVRATDNNNTSNFADRQYVMQVSPMQFDFAKAPTLPNATVGAAYSYTYKVIGATGAVTFTPSPLYPQPPGLTLSSSGVLSGTPTQSGAFSFYVTLTDSAGNFGYAFSSTLNVLQPGQTIPIAGTQQGGHDGSIGVAYSQQLATLATGGVQPIAWTAAPGTSLPPGMTILPGASGLPAFLGGIPTAAGAYTVYLAGTDAMGQTATSSVALNVSSLSVSPKLLPNGAVGSAYSATITPAGGTPPYNFAWLPSTSMPPGLSLSSTGVLSGTPTLATAANIYMTVSDSATPPNTLLFNYGMVVDQAGTAQGIGMTPPDIVQLSYVRTAPAPAPIPINLTATSGSLAFSAQVLGVPGLSLSSTSGSAPATLTLSLDPTGLAKGVYPGVIAVLAPTASNLYNAIPVVLTVTDPPPCVYSLTPSTATFSAGAGSGSFNVSTGSQCTWTATPSDSSVAVSPQTASGMGSGSVQYTVSANTGLSSRTPTITVGGQTYSITQFGSSCALTLTPSSVNATYAGGVATVNVITTNQACAWTASGLGAAPTSGTGNGAVTFTIPANGSVNSQTLMATVQLTGGASSNFTVMQTGLSCTVGLSAGAAGASYAGGPGEVDVTTPAGCSYNTLSGPNWISLTSGASGSGPGPVALTYSVSPNSSTVSRSGTLTIGDKPFTISQQGTPCSVTVDATQSGSPFGAAGGMGTLAIATNGSNCTWTATSPASWVTVTPSYGSGSGSLTLNVASSTTARSANLTIGGQSVAVTQSGPTCNFVLGSMNASVPYGGGSGSVTVTAPASCSWTSQTDPTAPWLSVSPSSSGGTGNATFSAPANTTAAARSGTLTVAGKPFQVTQAAAPCNYVLNASTSNLPVGGGSGTFTFSTGTSGCSTTAVSLVNWLTVTTTSSADGTSGTVKFTATANPNGTNRVGNIKFGGQSYSVNEAGTGCILSFASSLLTFPKGGGPGYVAVEQSIPGCLATPAFSDTQPGWVVLQPLQGPDSHGIYILQFTVSTYNSTVTGTRTATVTIAGYGFKVTQTSW